MFRRSDKTRRRHWMEDYNQLFAESYARVMGQGAYNPDFIGRFYDLFVGSSETVADKFANTDMLLQKTMLHDSFTTLLDFNAHRKPTDYMQRLAQVHGRSGNDIPPDLYELWLESLIAVVETFDEEFSRDVELAWRLTLAPGITYLKFAYEHPQQQEPAPKR